MLLKYNSKLSKLLSRLHWKLYFPVVGLLWLIIIIFISYFVTHELQRVKENLSDRLLNINNTVVDAYEQGHDLQKTVDFIHLFIDNTTLAPLRITVYDDNDTIIADNPCATINLFNDDGSLNVALADLVTKRPDNHIVDMVYEGEESMICSKRSSDGKVLSLAALPYEGAVVDFLEMDPMVWFVVLLLGILVSVLAYFGVRAICRNVYALRDFADGIANNSVPENIDSHNFTNDELGDVSKKLLTLYREKITAEQEKLHHERLVSMNISHELNTPVGIIKGYIDTVLADDNMPPATQRKFLERIQQNTNRIATLVADVSMMMRLDENASTLKCVPVNFYDLSKRLANDLEADHVGDRMSFVCNIPEDCVVMAHESLLLNALTNLAYNAKRYSGGTTITLEMIDNSDGFYIFSFHDDGCGVDKEHLGRLFDLFYRVDSGRTRKNGGSGLGLPLVHRIITSMGGAISVDNAPDGGLRFTFSIPSA